MKFAARITIAAAMVIATVATAATVAGAQASTLRMALPARPPGLGNPYASMSTGGLHPWGAMFDALTYLGDHGQVEPWLATRWETPTPTTWVFHLRDGIQFANGEPFNADTVVTTIEFLKRPESQQLFAANEVRGITAVRAVDGVTVEITTAKADAILDRRLSLIMMVPPKAWAAMGADAFAQQPIGTGPFVLEDWGQSRGRFALKRNPTSWRKSATIDRIEVAPLVDATPRMQALVSRQVDLAYNIGLDAGDDLRQQGFQMMVRERSPVEAWALPNTQPKAPTADVRVRR